MRYGYQIRQALESGDRTYELWGKIREAGGIPAGESLGASIFDMNYVAGLWRSVISSNVELSRASMSDAVMPNMWSYAPWTDGGAAVTLAPTYQIQYSATGLVAGSEYSVTRTATLTQDLTGMTVGDIYSYAQSSAEALALGDTGLSPPQSDALGFVGAANVAVVPGSVTIMRV